MKKEILIRGGRVLTMAPGAGVAALDALVRDGRIADLAPSAAAPSMAPDAEIVDASGCIVLPRRT